MGLFSSSISSVRKAFTDTFNRVNQTPLGTASDGTDWDNIRPGFSISSNKASATNPASYPLATVDFPSSNVNISLSGVDQGSSAALWVTDSGNWWAVGIDQAPVSCNCQTGSNCDAFTGGNCAAFQSSGGNCSGNFTLLAGNCSGNTNPPAYCTTWGTNTGTCRAWILPAGNCREIVQTNCRSSTGGFCRQNGGGFCRAFAGNCRSWQRFSRNCIAWNTANTCVGWNTINCNAWNTVTCNAWNTRCVAYNTRNNECDAWNTRNNFCSGFFNPPAFCSSWNTRETVCNGASYNFLSWNCTGFAYNAINCTQWSTFTFGCQTCYPQYIRLFQSVNSTVTEIFNWTVGSIIRSFRVRTNKDQLTIQAFSDDNHVSKIGSDIIFTPTGVAITPKFGILLKPSSFNQGTSIDGIEITRN
jgi:hypothetical protein